MLFTLFCSSSTHTWDAFHLARASFEFYCVQNNQVLLADSHDADSEMGPHLLGNCLKINVEPPEVAEEDDEESASGSLPAIKIHDDEVNLRFLVCGAPSTVVSFCGILFLVLSAKTTLKHACLHDANVYAIVTHTHTHALYSLFCLLKPHLSMHVYIMLMFM